MTAMSQSSTPAGGLHLKGATIMSTPTDTHLRIARDTGYAGVEVRGYVGPWSLETFHPAYWTEDPATIARRGTQACEKVMAASIAA
jgi:hypothetical protein